MSLTFVRIWRISPRILLWVGERVLLVEPRPKRLFIDSVSPPPEPSKEGPIQAEIPSITITLAEDPSISKSAAEAPSEVSYPL